MSKRPRYTLSWDQRGINDGGEPILRRAYIPQRYGGGPVISDQEMAALGRIFCASGDLLAALESIFPHQTYRGTDRALVTLTLHGWQIKAAIKAIKRAKKAKGE